MQLLKDIPPCPQWTRPRRGQEVPLQLLKFPACLEWSRPRPLQLLQHVPQQMKWWVMHWLRQKLASLRHREH